MKKLISLLLALVMVLSLSTVAMAYTSEDDVAQVVITKWYALNGNGQNPAETFYLKQVSASVSDGELTTAPDLVFTDESNKIVASAAFKANTAKAPAGEELGAKGTFTVSLPEYTNVGIYEYILQEVDNKTAGVTYQTDSIKLVVTVVNDETEGSAGKVRVAGVHTETGHQGTLADGTKTDYITNTYSAGTLNVSKTVEGILGDKTKYFEFEVTLEGEADKTYVPFSVTGTSYTGDPETITLDSATKTATVTFHLRHGDQISISNLPYDVKYTIIEKNIPSDYTCNKVDGYTGTINSEAFTAAFTNTKGGAVDTGVMLDSLPYILVLAFVAVAGTALIFKKRANV